VSRDPEFVFSLIATPRYISLLIPIQDLPSLSPSPAPPKSSQVNTLPKAKSQAKDKRAKDRQKYAALRCKVGVAPPGFEVRRRMSRGGGPPPPRLRENYYITRCCCSWPLLLMPLVQGASRTPTTTAWGAMTEVFSDNLNLKIGDLLSRPLSPASSLPCARPLMLTSLIQEHTRMFSHAIVYACAPATRTQPLLLARDPVQACAPASGAHQVFLARRARTPRLQRKHSRRRGE
jgi:hypothetical protein